MQIRNGTKCAKRGSKIAAADPTNPNKWHMKMHFRRSYDCGQKKGGFGG